MPADMAPDDRAEMKRCLVFAEALLSDDPAARPKETEGWDRWTQLCLAILDLLFPPGSSTSWAGENLAPGMSVAFDVGDMERLLQAVLNGDEVVVAHYLNRVTSKERQQGQRLVLKWPCNPGFDERRVEWIEGNWRVAVVQHDVLPPRYERERDGTADVTVETPTSFEELSDMTFAEALDAFDDRFEEHAAEEEERLRRQAKPGWAQEVVKRRSQHKVGVKCTAEQLATPPKPWPAADYSRRWEVEHDLLELKSCTKTASELIERFRTGTANHQHHFGAGCTMEQAIKKEEDSIAKWKEEAEPLEWELAWLQSSTAFDFTGESYCDDPFFILEKEGEALNHYVEVEQRIRSEWFALTKEQLTWLRKLDRAIYRAGDAVLPESFDGDDGGPLVKWMADTVGGATHLELVAAGRELAKRDPTFWRRLRDIGPTPSALREANHILRGAVQQECAPRKAAAVGVRAKHLISSARARTARCSSPRVRGSRRATSRSPGGGSDSDESGGSSDPPKRQYLDSPSCPSRRSSYGSPKAASAAPVRAIKDYLSKSGPASWLALLIAVFALLQSPSAPPSAGEIADAIWSKQQGGKTVERSSSCPGKRAKKVRKRSHETLGKAKHRQSRKCR